MTDKELYQQMLHFIECSGYRAESIKKELKIRLAQPEPEPVAWMNEDVLRIDHIIKAPIQVCRRKQDEHYNIPLYTAPPKKEWVGLTDEEIKKLSDDCVGVRDETEFIRAIEAKLNEKNT